jgi:hypothetical protein
LAPAAAEEVAMRAVVPILAVLIALPSCAKEEEPVANRYERQKAEIENKAQAFEAQVENEVKAVEAQQENLGSPVITSNEAVDSAGAEANANR